MIWQKIFLYAIEEFLTESMHEPATISFPATATQPKKASVPFHIVAEVTVTPIAAIMKHVAAHWGSSHGTVNHILRNVNVVI
mmetsp:Transcript_4185/g.11544  ORF Transcript_4185/g.11544 Transcript_4185/m.11544 type:complete len:82 (+) Transcript_4185:1154-1399(+)